ncbi:MAG TPA: phosphatidylserine decarboxylase [Pirellulales bacterium]|jgi:phosphatidylserine decarboxylase|nr:phosphatidylserine decarboxylase [Pirellulales bacterium]
MSQVEASCRRAEPEPLPPNLISVQPGGGVCYSIELAWGRWRRRWLRTFRPAYVRRMAEKMRGSAEGAPHEILDPRDLKYCRNLCTAEWNNDPFSWRGRLGFARWGLAELQLIGYPLLAVTISLAYWWWYLAMVPGVVLGLIVWFFRDPPRRVPQQPGLIVAPADGTISEVTRLEHDDFVGGPAVKIGIFLSIFNVHINRVPAAVRVIRLKYGPGLFLDARDPDSRMLNENMWIGLEEDVPPHRKLVVRQIAGLFARRIVCNLRPGETVARGHKFGMIKLGSRTELILPDEDGLELLTAVGQKVAAGKDVVAKYR